MESIAVEQLAKDVKALFESDPLDPSTEAYAGRVALLRA